MHDNFLTKEAITYTWRQLLTRAGYDITTLPLSLHYDLFDSSSSSLTVMVEPCDFTDWQDLLNMPPNSLSLLPIAKLFPSEVAFSFNRHLPILFWGTKIDKNSSSLVEHRENLLIFHYDIIAATFFMLSRWEETIVSDRDEYGRFPATSSVAYKQGFLDRPIVDEYALILREWLKVLLPGWEPRPRAFSVKLSHDIDQTRRFLNGYTALRTLGGDLLKRYSLKDAWQTGVDVITEALAPEQTDYFQGIYSLAELSRRSGVGNDAFYFMAAEPEALESDYDPSTPMMRRCIKDLRAQGFEIGLHAGYHTLNDPERLAAEKARLDVVLGETRYGGRQHFLRFQTPSTWRHWEQAGLSYDSTMAYADREGFRCGTCHPFRPFDVEQNCELDLWELPLVVMDGTLYQYRGLTPEQGEAQILKLARRCRQVEGTFTLLWHNSSLDREWAPWYEMYQRVLHTLAAMEPVPFTFPTDKCP